MSTLSKNLLKRSKELNLPYTWISESNSSLSMKYVLSKNSIFDLNLDDSLYKTAVDTFMAFYKAYRTIYREDDKLFDFIPQDKLNIILDNLLESLRPYVPKEIPVDYKFQKDLDSLIQDIQKQKVNIIGESDVIRKCFGKTTPFIDYNLYGTVTGRLTTSRSSFPILTMAKNCRELIHPSNDFFLELDYNSCDIRTLLALQGIPQPEQDIHEWNKENVFKGKFDRKKCKQQIFAWMYNPSAQDEDIASVYDKTEILKKHYLDGEVNNGYRKIKCDEHHALSYLIQSLSSDIFLRNAIKIHKTLKGKKSKVAFLMHDSVIIDMSNEDKEVIERLSKLFSKTDFGDFKVNISTGKNYGEMNKIDSKTI